MTVLLNVLTAFAIVGAFAGAVYVIRAWRRNDPALALGACRRLIRKGHEYVDAGRYVGDANGGGAAEAFADAAALQDRHHFTNEQIGLAGEGRVLDRMLTEAMRRNGERGRSLA